MGALLSSLYSAESQLAEIIPAYVPQGHMWVGVRQRFDQFHQKLQLSLLQMKDGLTKHTGVLSCLDQHYYGTASGENHGLLIGSWGKDTAIRPPRDVDTYFILPPEVYYRFEKRTGNRQSTLLQEIRSALMPTYPDTEMRADGQVVIVRFGTYAVEVVPAFLLTDGRYWICDTSDQGSYKVTDPNAEAGYIEQVDSACNRNLRPLIRMLKSWQATCTVPIKSFQLELVAAEFLAQSPWRHYGYFYFDWIVRDFFAYLCGKASTYIAISGTGEQNPLGNEWQSRAYTAWGRALKACELDKANWVDAAGEEWQKIFGSDLPRRPRWN
jgi:hypothetical protein